MLFSDGRFRRSHSRFRIPSAQAFATFRSIYRRDPIGTPNRSPFALRYFGYELWSFFVRGPQWQAAFPTSFSPPAASRRRGPVRRWCWCSRRPRGLDIGLWIATVLVAGPSFNYYVNGFAQFGMRRALDFEPFVIVLMTLPYPSRVPPRGRALIVWSVRVSIWGVWLTVLLYHH
jgi:hypothetical protein